MKKILVILSTLAFLTSCLTTSKDISVAPAPVEMEELFETGNWFATADEFGSTFTTSDPIISNDEINVDFDLIQKSAPEEWPYIELICESGKQLTGVEAITIEYRCDKDLKIKLSQSDFGSEGDSSYAHYFTTVPASSEWSTATVNIADFAQPGWAPSSATEVALNLNKIQDIYLVPNASYEVGESASLSVRSLVIQ